MKKRIKEEKGITLTILVVTTVVILILTGTIIYNAKNDLDLKNLKAMKVDINNLREKIISYYSKYDDIPILYKENGNNKQKVEYTNLDAIRNSGILSEQTDIGKFYVLDLGALENLSLNFGREYEKIRNTDIDPNTLMDIYIINENSNNIFYVRGITIDSITYYTDYTPEEKEKERIPVNVIKAGEKAEYENKIYANEGVAKIPKGFTVSKLEGEISVEKGLVIYDIPNNDVANINWYADINGNGIYDVQEKYNQFVWIPVNDMADFKRTEGYGNFDANDNSGKLQGALGYCGEMDKNGSNQKLNEENILKEETKKMYASVEENKGFYIGRYESGTTQNRTSVLDPETEISISKNKNPYNHIKWLEKDGSSNHIGGVVKLSRELYNNANYGAKSTLCYGVQWDAILNFINNKYITFETGNGKPNCEIYSFIVDSRYKGNHQGKINKTGINEEYSVKNIYDMSGNLWEWTMEVYDLGNGKTRVARGGSYMEDGFKAPVSNRTNIPINESKEYLGFRVTLFVE